MFRLLGVFVFLISSFSGLAQSKNILIDPRTAAGVPSIEPSIAINLKNTDNIVAASSSGTICFTKDGGLSWKKVAITSPGISNSVVVSDDKGTFYYIHLSTGTDGVPRILSHRSEDGGETWDEAIAVDQDAGKIPARINAVVDAKGTINLTWTQFDKYKSDDEACKSVIVLSRSGSGKKWSKPIVISQTPGSCKDDDTSNTGGVPVVGLDGKQFVAWASHGKIYMDRSYDGDMWLSNDIGVVDIKGGWNFNVPGQDRCNGLPYFAIDNTKSGMARGSLYMLWSDQQKGAKDTDIWFVRSSTYGDNWNTPLRVNDDGPGNHQYMPAFTIDQTTGYLYVVYYDRREGEMITDVYLAYSSDYGISFKNKKISESPFTPQAESTFGSYIGIAAYKGYVTPVWTRMENGKTSIVTTVIRQADLITTPPAKGKKKK